MKLIIAIAAIVLIGSVSAQENAGKELVESLIKRGEQLLHDSHIVIAALREHGKEHLIETVQHQLVMVEALVIDLKETAKHVTEHNLHHIHLLEEDLLSAENHIGEEFEVIIMHVMDKDHGHHTPEQVLERAEKLVEKAKEAIDKHEHSKESRMMKHELFAIERLVKDVKRGSKYIVPLVVEQLARHEHTLANLIKRAENEEEHHHHHHDEEDNE